MNILELQEDLKDLPDRRLIQEMQMPTGAMPQFLVLSELTRRKRMRNEYKRQAAADTPTVAEEVVAGAGVPQEGLMAMAGAMAPNTNVAQDTGLTQAMPMQATRAPQPMADGGIVRMANGGSPNRMDLAAQIMRTVNPRARSIYDDVNALPREALISIYGIDAVREAESLLLPAMKDLMEEVPTEGRLGRYPSTFSRGELRKMEDQGIFGNKSYRDPSQSTYLGGERVNQSTDKAPTIDYTDPQSLQEIDPDSTTFVAPEVVSEPRLNMDTAGGLGSMSLDSSVPEMALDSPLLLRQIIDSGVGTRGADTDPAQQLAEFLASRRSDLPGVNLPGESNPYVIDPDAAEKQGQAILDSLTMDDLMRQAKIEREGFGAGVEDQLSLKEQLANKLGFAVDANKSERLSEINTPPPSVIAAQANAAAETEDKPTQEIPYNPGTTVIDYNPRNTGEAQFQLETEQAYNQKLYTDRLAIERRIDRLKEVAETPDDFERLATLEAYLDSMGGSTAENPNTAQLRQAELNFGKFVMDEREDALMANVARDLKVATDTVAQLELSLESATAETKPMIEKRLLEEQANLAQAKTAYDQTVATLDQDPTESDISTVPTMTEILGGKAPLEAVIVPDKVSGGTKTVVENDVFRTPTGNFNDAELATVGGEQTTAEIAPLADERRDDDPELKLPTVTTDDNTDNVKPVTDPDPEGFGSTDSRIAKMLSERQKQAESDKWMALAQAGFKMMTSKSPTLLGAVGEGGEAGLKALSASKKGLRDFETDMLKLETQLAAARLRSKGSTKMAPAALVTAAASRLRTARDTLDNAVSPVEKQNALDAYNAALEEYNNINAFVASQYGYTPSSSTGVGNNVPNLGDSANQSANQ